MTDFEKIIERVNCERAKLAEIEKTIQSIREPYNAQRAKLNLEEASAVAPYGPIMAAQKLEIEVAEKEFVRLRKNAVAVAFKEKAPGDLNELKDWIQCVGNDILAARGDDPIERFYMEPLNCAEKAGDCKIIAARITKYYEKRIYCVSRGARADEPKNDSFCPNCAGSGQYKADGKLKPCPVCLETGIKEI